MQLCRIYKETLLRGRRRGASAPAGPRDENSLDAPKYLVVIVRDSSSTNAAGLKLFDHTLATSGRHTQIAADAWPSRMHMPSKIHTHKHDIVLMYVQFIKYKKFLSYL